MSARARVLVLAGHDPTGGAGVDADARALRAAGGERAIEALCVVTNRTRQDGRRVHAIDPVPIAVWTQRARRLFDASADDGSAVRVVKTGMLTSAEQIDAVAEIVVAWRALVPELAVVVDPVLAASGGETFLDLAGTARLVECFSDLAPLVTPNVPELAALVARDATAFADDVARRVEAAAALLARGARAVAVKGGHGREDPVVDVVIERRAGASQRVSRVERPRVDGPGLHGSGCRFAAFAAGRLALGDEPAAACEAAGDFVHGLLTGRS